jgi:hypothetical protein
MMCFQIIILISPNIALHFQVDETNVCAEKEKYTNYQIIMSNIQLVSNKTLTLAEVYKIVKIFGISMEISNFDW